MQNTQKEVLHLRASAASHEEGQEAPADAAAVWTERLRVETDVLHRAYEELRVEYEARLRQAEADLHDAVAKVCTSNHFAAFKCFS